MTPTPYAWCRSWGRTKKGNPSTLCCGLRAVAFPSAGEWRLVLGKRLLEEKYPDLESAKLSALRFFVSGGAFGSAKKFWESRREFFPDGEDR